ncbi:MAG TPA: OmpA family protein [Prosthecobacter sp.]
MRDLSHQPSCRLRRRLQTGGALPAVIVFLALVISAVVFFVFTRPALEKKETEAKGAATKEQAEGGTKPVQAPATASSPAKPPTASTAPAVPAAPAKPVFGFARPLDLGKEMVRSLTAGDYVRAGELVAAGDPAQNKEASLVMEKMIKELGAKVGAESQIELLGLVENKTRLSIPFNLPGQQEPVRLQLDVERDDKMGWKVASLQLPKELAGAMPAQAQTSATANSTPPAASVTAPTPASGKAGTAATKSPAPLPKPAPKKPLFSVEETPDALTFGSDFVRALLKHDFVSARKFVDESKVASERLAGLCIVFEEGQYEFKPAKPLIITVANPEVSWVIAQVQSQKLQQSTEFGIEMKRDGVDKPWQVVGLNLSEILSSFASSATKAGVPYTPIVNNPKGGESLALYFEYDQAELHERALKQLEIVAGMLKSDPSKKLRIAGHTDAKGTDNYNLALSQSRAESVKKQLSALGVAAAQIITEGMGKAQPLSPNQKADGTDDPEGRSKNRRAEIYLDF